MELRAVINIFCCLIRFAVAQQDEDYFTNTEIANETTTIGYLSLEDECKSLNDQLSKIEDGCKI